MDEEYKANLMCVDESQICTMIVRELALLLLVGNKLPTEEQKADQPASDGSCRCLVRVQKDADES